MNQPVAVAALTSGVRRLDFAELVRRNEAMVYSIARHFVCDGALAEELAQEVFLQLYRNLDKLDSAEHAARWLRRVTSHRCIDFARKRRRERPVDLDSAPEPVCQPQPADPLLRERLRKLVASLPAKKRLLIILRYQEEMEPEEIARTLRMPARTVRTQLHRTLALLREKAARILGEETS